MNKNILIGVSFALGAAAGVAASMGYFRKKYADEAKEEIDKVMEDYRNRMSELEDESEPVDADISEEIYSVDDPEHPIAKIPYNTIDAVTEKSIEEYRGIPDAVVDDISEEPSDLDPYPINMDSFISDHNEYDKITYRYFIGDEVLCDEHGQTVNIDETVTKGLIDIFLKSSLETFYIRNPKIYADFEIEKIESDYSVEYGVYE